MTATQAYNQLQPRIHTITRQDVIDRLMRGEAVSFLGSNPGFMHMDEVTELYPRTDPYPPPAPLSLTSL